MIKDFYIFVEKTIMYLDNYLGQIREMCYKNRVKHLFAFGSVLTDTFSDESDVDLLVDLKSNDPFDYAENYFNLKFQLEELLKRPVDLLEEKGLKNKYLLESINQSKRLIYEA